MRTTDIDLLGGEQIVWEGRPVQGWLIRPVNRVSFGWFAVWCLFATLIAGRELIGGASPIATTALAAFIVLVGGAVVAWWLVADRLMRAGTKYVLTDTRMIMASKFLFFAAYRAEDRSALAAPKLYQAAPNVGTVWFGDRPPIGRLFGALPPLIREETVPLGLDSLENPTLFLTRFAAPPNEAGAVSTRAPGTLETGPQPPNNASDPTPPAR